MLYPEEAMLELDKDDLSKLNEKQLEDLVGRLAEAEVVARGGQISEVLYGGSINASDGGVDVRVNVVSTTFTSDFIHRPNTIFQCKKSGMPKNRILAEMRPQGELRPAIAQQAAKNGGYVIVSLDDDCAEPVRDERLQAMQEAIEGYNAIHLDFIDRSRLHQWLRRHLSIMIWTREILGQPLSGWRSFGRWSDVPAGASDDFIFGSGISVMLPNNASSSQKLTLKEAITSTRDLVRGSQKAIRIVGLSGVGKTRFVQVLFESEVGEDALDNTTVIYTDTGAEPNPSASRMIEQLISEKRRATVVVDNCSSALHSQLANDVRKSENNIQLITVEYDIQDDHPEMTDVIKIEADGIDIAKNLILRRYPRIGDPNAERIADCAGGNARIALALAGNVGTRENVTDLSNKTLFDRIFKQRNPEDSSLKRHAGILSLVYSFAAKKKDDEPDELGILGSLCDASPKDLYESAQELLRRGVAQKRGRWRAVLPQAIANHLAKSALHNIRPSDLQKTFEVPDNDRLIMSFAHRIRLLGDPPDSTTQEIVRSWLSDGGLLLPILSLDETKAQILEYIVHVCPSLLLERLEVEIDDSTFINLSDFPYDTPNKIVNLIILLANDSNFFERCIDLLLMAMPRNSPSAIENKVLQLFQPRLSGTHASAQQRADVLKQLIWSDEKRLQDLGVKMLSKTLAGPPWYGLSLARIGFSRELVDYGSRLNKEEFRDWRRLFLDITVQSCLDDDPNRSKEARKIFAQSFRNLWSENALHDQLIQSAKKLNNHYPWIEGWKAINEIIYFDYKVVEGGEVDNPAPAELLELRNFLTPKDLDSSIKLYLSENSSPSELDTEFDDSSEDRYEAAGARIKTKVINLGEQFAKSNLDLEDFGTNLFSENRLPNSYNFGIGLAKGAENLNATWDKLVATLKGTSMTSFDYGVLAGFIHETARIDKNISTSILDACLEDSLLGCAIVPLHPQEDFTEDDFDRCMKAIENPEINPFMHEYFLGQREYNHLPKEKKLHLARILLEHPKGTEILIRGLGMKIHGSDKTVDILGLELRQIGLSVAIKYLNVNDDRLNDSIIYNLKAVIRNSLSHAGNDDLKSQLLDTVFSGLDAYRYWPGQESIFHAIADILPEYLLDRTFSGDEKQQSRRRKIFESPLYRNKKSILVSVDIGRIIEWCLKRNEPLVWKTIAQSLPVFVSKGDSETVKLSDTSIRFLEASPYPEEVLTGYVIQIAPNTWSGHRSVIMEKNIGAFRTLVEHENQQISLIAGDLYRKAEARIARQRESEQREDENREQRFE